MQIKHKVKFELRPYGKDGNLQMIRIRASYSGARLTLTTGCSVTDACYCDDKSQLVIDGYEGPNGETAVSINNIIRNCRDQMNTAFSFFEANDIVPTLEQLKAKYQERLKGTTPKMPEEPRRERKKESLDRCYL